LAQNRTLPPDESSKNHHTVGGNGAATFVVDAGRKLVTVKFGKKVTAADIANYASRLRDHPSFQPSFSEICDLSNIEHLDLSADDFLRLADQVDPFAEDAKRAFVVRTQTHAHAARMHKALRVHRHFEIFYSPADAERWIEK